MSNGIIARELEIQKLKEVIDQQAIRIAILEKAIQQIRDLAMQVCGMKPHA